MTPHEGLATPSWDCEPMREGIKNDMISCVVVCNLTGGTTGHQLI